MLFTSEDLKKIELAVKAAELNTSGEVVPVVVDCSGDYSKIGHRLGLLGLVLATLLALWAQEIHPFRDTIFLLGMEALGWVLGWSVGQLPAVTRLFVSSERMAAEVHESAMASFLHHGLHNTRDRTGILLYVSVLEHRVEILADRGIHEKVGEGYWKEEVEKLVQGMRQRKAGAAMVEVIGEIGQKLSEHFPRREGDRNELGDELRSR